MDLGGETGGAAVVAAPVCVALDAFTAGLDQLVKVVSAGGLDTLDRTGLIAFMQAVETTRNRLPLIDHGIIERAEGLDLPDELCQGSLGRVLSSALRISKGEANRRVRAAEAVGPRTSQLGEPLAEVRPQLAAAQRTGTVSPEQVDIIARALQQVDRPGFDPADLDAGEQILTEQAAVFGPEDLRELAKRVVEAINPDGTLPDDQLNDDRRHLHLRPTRDGAYLVEGRLTGSLGVKIKALLDPLAQIRPPVLGPDGRVVDEDSRPHGQRIHDALEEVSDRLLRCGDTTPDAGGTPATLIVTISLDDLLTKLGYGRTADGTLLPTKKVLELAAQADLIPAVLTKSGAVLDLGRSRRIASRSQTVALYARDAGCSFPGCFHPPQYCQRHHIIAWIDGGPTDLNNLTLVCTYHHHNFLARGWTCRMNPDGIPEWTPPKWVSREQKPMVNTRIQSALVARQGMSSRRSTDINSRR